MNDHTDIIKLGDKVILKGEKNIKVFEIHRNRSVYVDKLHFTLDVAIGEPYGAVFQIRNGKLIKCERTKYVQVQESVESGTDNRLLQDQTCNQQLRQEQIEDMKKQGISGQNIIGQLIENSKTFALKTEYAQEKYLKKKKSKHDSVFSILRPTTRLISEMYFNKMAVKICNLRPDTLAQILTHADVQAGINMAVVDSCNGLVVGAVMERMGGYGKLIHLHPGDIPVRPCLDAYAFSSKHMAVLCSFPLSKVSSFSELKHDPTTNGHSKTSTDNREGLSTETHSSASPVSTCTENTSGHKGDEGHDNLFNTPRESVLTLCSDSSVKVDGSEHCHSSSEPSKEQANLAIDMEIESTPQYDREDSAHKRSKTDDKLDDHSTNLHSNAAVKADDSLMLSTVGDSVMMDSKNAPDAVNDQSHAGLPEGSMKNGGNKKRKSHKTDNSAKLERKRQETDARETIVVTNLDSLIVAGRLHPTPIVKCLIPFVRPSRPVVIFCQYKEPLMDIYTYMRDNGLGVNFNLTETWLREYQVLPERTRPVNNMSGNSGYLLTWITVSPDKTHS